MKMDTCGQGLNVYGHVPDSSVIPIVWAAGLPSDTSSAEEISNKIRTGFLNIVVFPERKHLKSVTLITDQCQ